MSVNQTRDPVQLVFRKAAVLGECDRIEPEFSNTQIEFHMDMDRLASIGTEENKAIRSLSKDSWHRPGCLALERGSDVLHLGTASERAVNG